MIAALSRYLARWRGTGEAAITTPPMDGALQPNQAIEAADLVVAANSPDNLVYHEGKVLFSSGRSILRLDGSVATKLDAEVACLAANPKGSLAIGLVDGRILIKGGQHDGFSVTSLGGASVKCPTALHFDGDGGLLLCIGSRKHGPQQWKRDLMERRAEGSVWRLPLDGGEAQCLAEGLAFPNGILQLADGRLIIAESWRSRLVELLADGKVKPVLADLPGYPARIVAGGGPIWLTVFAPRSQLIEFVLRERDYCDEMIRTIPDDQWVAPALTPPQSFLEPLQGGALKQLGMLKPWAPTRSFGLVIELDRDLRPVASWHSRADGIRHGITSCLEDNGRLLVASKGGNAVLALAIGASP